MTASTGQPQVADLIQRYEKALLPREQRPAGYDTPDWRWRWIIDNICRIEKMDSFPPPLLYSSYKTPPQDMIIRRIVIPYIHMRIGSGCYLEPPPTAFLDSMNVVMKIAGKVKKGLGYDASRLEAAILADRPRGYLAPDMKDVDAWAQYFYELLFLDIREILDDREAIITQVLATRLPDSRVAQCHLKAKVLSYWMTSDEYEAWQTGKPTDIVAEMSGVFDQYMSYLRVLEDLSVEHSEDMANTIRRFYGHGDRLRKQKSHPDHAIHSAQSVGESLNMLKTMITAMDA